MEGARPEAGHEICHGLLEFSLLRSCPATAGVVKDLHDERVDRAAIARTLQILDVAEDVLAAASGDVVLCGLHGKGAGSTWI